MEETGQPSRRVHAVLGCAASIAACFLWSSPADALRFRHGDLEGALDTTLSYGSSLRVQGQDEDLICRANGGNAFGCNADDGNLNYATGEPFRNIGQFTSELDLNYRHRVGFFSRATGFLDVENENGSRERTPLGEDTKNLVGSTVDVLDFYGWGAFDAFGMPGEIRVGKHVVNWGESTFIPNGINIINPVDVSKLRVPGAEIREALLPLPLVSGNLSLTNNLSVEAFYQLDWDKITLDPNGFYFSTNDFVPTDGRKVMLGFGDISDLGAINPGLGAPGVGGRFDPNFNAVPRAPDVNPEDSDQWGVAVRLFVPALNDTEFGFFFINFHNRLPIVSARTGTQAAVGNATAAAVGGACFLGLPSCPVGGAVAGSVAGATGVGAGAGAAAGAGSPAPSATRGVTAAANVAAGTAGATAVSDVARDLYAQSARYFVEYPENTQLYGFSFNTQLGATGVALQGEVSHRQNVPLQIDDVELLFAALSPLGALNPAVLTNQVGVFGPDTVIPGFFEANVTQVQATASKAFSNVLGANQAIILGEVAVHHVHNMPSRSDLRLNAPGTFTSGNPFHATAAGGHPGKPAEAFDNFPSPTSWGYRLAGRLQYNAAIGAVNLLPRFSWRHDVNGISPGPGGPFLEGRKAIELGITATYLEQWEFDLSYTNFFGAGRHNLLNDRDFIAASLQFSF